MSRIQKLIERARQERSSREGSAQVAVGAAAFSRPVATAQMPPAPPVEGLDFASLRKCELPRGANADQRVLLQQEDAAGAVSSYKMLRTRVLQRMRANRWQSIAVSSQMPGEGKSLTAINLAISIARDPTVQCTLVELDLRAPSMCEYLRLQVESGVEDYLLGNAALRDVVLATSENGLYVAPVRRRQQNSSELLASPTTRDMVAGLAATPTMTVIYDLPPILQADDLLAFAPLVDAVLLVVAEGQTNRDELAQAREVFSEVNLLGVVLNKSSDRVDGYGY